MNKDKLGIILSAGCMVHCVLMPLVLPLLPLMGFTISHSPWFHIGLATIISIIACIALNSGFKKHYNGLPIVLGMLGVLGLFLGGLVETLSLPDHGEYYTLIGSVLLITAHYLNHCYSCKCKHHASN